MTRSYLNTKPAKDMSAGLIKAILLLFLLLMLAGYAHAEEATSLSLDVTNSNGNGSGNIRDKNYDTKLTYAAGESITLSAKENIAGVYLIWAYKPCTWSLSYGDEIKSCGKSGFLHEYVTVGQDTKTVTVTFDSEASICDVYAYSEGELPKDVQVWQPSCEEADFLVFSTHSDDEILFFGGVLATYAGEQNLNVQVVYMTNYWNGLRIREHEKLDGIWESGVKNYPVNMPFDDIYAESLAGAESVYSYNDILECATEQIRRFKPNIIITHDFDGEYGHGGHMILAKAVAEAAEKSKDAEFCSESAGTYGTWDTPKTYLHLYSENQITMDLRVPLEKMEGRTALEVAADAYLKHVSQQWCWFYVSDDYEYSCADFGLYRSTVGVDTGNDMLENIITKAEQARLEEEALAEQEKADAALTQAAQALTPTKAPDSQEATPTPESNKKTDDNNSSKTWIIILVVILILLVVSVGCLLFMKTKHKQANARRNTRQRKTSYEDYEDDSFEDEDEESYYL